ncbi:MAG TPA: hypothetical protein VJ738_16715 [Steroidobacteraceae bacterium]|nr:hypothetical protein [Steroidobacteraceae bacterium]
MGLVRRIGLAVVTAALAVGAGTLWAGDPPQQGAAPPVDEKLLEFLGSIDSSADPTQPDDGSWLAYLSKINIGKVAKASQAPPPARGQPKSASPAAGADKPSG